MKICVLLSSYEDAESDFADYGYQDPSLYVNQHEFVPRFIEKDTAVQQIDRVCKENFDLFINFIWGQKIDAIAGVNAVEYLESKGVPFIGPSSKFLSLSKIHFKKAAAGIILVPGDSKFPLVVKPATRCVRLSLTEKSVCHNPDELKERIALLKSKMLDDIIVEEFIVGQEISVMVVEIDDEVIAMTPVVYEFPAEIPPIQKSFLFKNRFDAVAQGTVKFRLFSGDLLDSLKETACKAYRALDVSGCGYARIDIRVSDKEIYVLNVNPTPALFCKIGNDFGDDYVISNGFPRGHEGFMETLIKTKLRSSRILEVKKTYDLMSDKYSDSMSSRKYSKVLADIAAKYSFQGSVLDLGCGTGEVGTVLQGVYDATMTGIDISPKMAAQAKHYKKVYLGEMQNMVPFVGRFDHVVSFGALLFLQKEVFIQTLDNCFALSRYSITVGIEDISDEFNRHLTAMGKEHLHAYDNTLTTDSYTVPEGWHLVHRQRDFFWTSISTGDEIYGTTFRFEVH
ncbi:hypothetical protein BGW38_007121 [Lunasporangiospora selenospora]|uniref:ATP-grasp domain-containing protein n=1 Tax=Lunasporangiospora selenospora TaxID=979761 RepID=A0A9P6FMU4_9FUNG|nr:hypothetical protein BGW38_007121 [Lunasporangiospora selenospora]